MLRKAVCVIGFWNAVALGGGASLGIYAMILYLYLCSGMRMRWLESAGGPVIDSVLFAVVRFNDLRSFFVIPAGLVLLMAPGALLGSFLHKCFSGHEMYRALLLVQRTLFGLGIVFLAMLAELIINGP